MSVTVQPWEMVKGNVPVVGDRSYWGPIGFTALPGDHQSNGADTIKGQSWKTGEPSA